MCSRCICNTTIPGIRFDDNGVCNYCHEYDERDKDYPLNDSGQQKLKHIIETIKKSGKGKEYDCVIGVSGGTDSTYCLYLARQWGLRPLAVHFDNCWNTEISVSNIKKATDRLDIDLFTWVADWEEFRALQIAFLKASVPEADIPTDMGYLSVLYKVTRKNGIKYYITGSNFRTEGNEPPAWGYADAKYINSVYRKFNNNKNLKKIPNHSLLELIKNHYLDGMRLVKPLWYINYNKQEAMSLLEKEIGWKYYGGHHYENIYTRFIHGYYLPTKFGIDKRIIEYSALIRSHQMTREDALRKIQNPPYPLEQANEDLIYILKKLNLTNDEFQQIMNSPNKMFIDYDTYYPLIIKMRFLINFTNKLKICPRKVYGKYSYK
jgi:N-acetyl sugar amidotransferase